MLIGIGLFGPMFDSGNYLRNEVLCPADSHIDMMRYL